MNRGVRLRKAARRELDEIADHFSGSSLAVALRFATAVEAAFSRLVENPQVGHLQPGEDLFTRQVRSWPVPGFEAIRVFYRPSPRGIEVVHIVHGARDLPAILEEE